jgi:integrase
LPPKIGKSTIRFFQAVPFFQRFTTGVAAVQRILRHADPRLTTETYGHLVPDYLRVQIDRLFWPPARSRN